MTLQKFSFIMISAKILTQAGQLDHLYYLLISNEILHNTSKWSSNLLKITRLS